jgi:hypothetical protein
MIPLPLRLPRHPHGSAKGSGAVVTRSKRAKDLNCCARVGAAVGEALRRSVDGLMSTTSPAQPMRVAITVADRHGASDTRNDRPHKSDLMVATAEVTDVR